MRRVTVSCGILLAVLGGTNQVWGQIGEQGSQLIEIVLDSGRVDNPSPYTEISHEQIAYFGDVEWFRLLFDDVELAPGSYLRITSLQDGAVQDLDLEALQQWEMTSAYFNGDAARIEIIAAAGSTGNRYRLSGAAVSMPPPPQQETLCQADNRVIDNRNGIARMVTLSFTGPCSATLMSPGGCFFSAGHCAGTLGIAEFNVPPSSAGGLMQHPSPASQYVVDPASITFVNGGPGNDYSRFTCFPNTQTNLTPFQAEGVFYPFAATLPPLGTLLRVTGFGSDTGTANNAQQTATGPLVTSSGTLLNHRVDTMPGNSGSSIIVDATNQVVGIHTHGGCSDVPSSFNSGTSILHSALTCCVPPNITGHPQSASACTGDTVSFTVQGAGDKLTYQWLHNNMIIPGATEQTYTIDFVLPVDAGSYACIVADPCEALSAPATLVVDPPPVIESHPMSTTTCLGGSAMLQIQMAGEGAFSYQWRFGHVDIPGATSPTLVIDPVSQADLGPYRCAVNDGCGTALSNQAVVGQVPDLTLLSNPTDVDATVGGFAFFTVNGIGGAVTFQWRKDGMELPGQTLSFLVITNVQCDDAGEYDAVLTNLCESVISASATLHVDPCGQPGDFDGDGDIDLADFDEFLNCVNGPAGEIPTGCESSDITQDGHVDWADFGEFQLAFTGG